MGDNDKDERHAHEHDQDQGHDHDEAHGHGDDQEHHAAPRRVADADRKDAGIKTSHDVEAMLWKAETYGKKTRITFGPSVAAYTGDQQAFKQGMKGYVRLDKNHMLAQFTITDVKREGMGGNKITAHAIVDVPAGDLDRTKQPGLDVIVNPTSYPALAPKSQHNVKARVVNYKRDEETTEDYRYLLMALVGLESGIRVGMSGDALDDGGKKIGSVVVRTSEDGRCWLAIHSDKVTASSTRSVLINPSTP